MIPSKNAVASILSLLLCSLTVSAQESESPQASESDGIKKTFKNSSAVSRQFIELAYDDAEAGFNGMQLAALYKYNDDYFVSVESAMLRGHSINYKHVFVGLQHFFNPLERPSLPLVPVARAGILYSSFGNDSEYGVLLGARVKSSITSKIILEAGLDWHSAGENSMVWNYRASYDLSDSLYVHTTYSASDIDELTLGVGANF